MPFIAHARGAAEIDRAVYGGVELGEGVPCTGHVDGGVVNDQIW